MAPPNPKKDQASRVEVTAPSSLSASSEKVDAKEPASDDSSPSPPSRSELTVEEAAKKVGERNREALTELAKW